MEYCCYLCRTVVLLLNLLLSTCSFIFLSTNVQAQDKNLIKGNVCNVEGLRLSGISVLLLQKADSSIVIFTETDSKGNFEFNISNSVNYLIKVNALGYTSQIVPIEPNKTEYNFILQESQLQLKEVIVKNKQPVVKMSGDTITYRADDFASPQDRTIGDVLKKIPGITVAENGQIKFNGQNVGKLYLDGDDLLESKYNIATRTLPNDIVNQIQVLENHQSIKALEGKVFSDAVDINLTFKDKAKLKLFGQANLGGGLPAQYEEEANLISLKNSYKAIHTVRANNTALAYTDDVISLNQLQELAKQGFQPINPQLATGTGSYPPIDQNRYLFNHSGLANSANLWKLKKDIQIKSKVYYEYDQQKQCYQNQTNILLPNEVINYNEQQNKTILPQNLYGDLILYKNKSEYYLNNKLSFEYKRRKEDAALYANDFKRFQNYQFQSSSFSNELDFIQSPKGKTLKQYYSFISFQRQPEELNLDSASYPLIFKSQEVLKNIKQQVFIPTFFTNNYLSLQNGKGAFSQSYKLGFSANMEQFKTELSANGENGNVLYPDSSQNQLKWRTYKAYLEPTYEWKKGNFRLIAKLPLRYQIINSFEDNNALKIDDRRLLINENFSLRYNKDKGISGSIFYIKTASAGNFLQTYSGLVLNDYRSYTLNNQIFSTSNLFNTGAVVRYKNPFKIFFINLSAYYQETLSNTINYQIVNQNLSYSERRLLDNTASSININTDISKYIFYLRASLSLSYGYQTGLTNQFFNNQLYPFVNTSQSLGLRWNGRVGEKLRYNYEINYQSYSNRLKEKASNIKPFEINNVTQKLSLEYDLKENFFMKTNSSFLKNKNDNGLNITNTFWDMEFRYKLNQQKIDFSLSARNLLNIKNYKVAQTRLNTQNYSSYPLLGRMIIFKIQFTF